jgi:hypothetical protein
MHLVVASIVFMLMVTAIITWKWARAEQAFLEKPEGKKPLGLLQRQDAGEEENRKTG